jgi:hypothetical protein
MRRAPRLTASSPHGGASREDSDGGTLDTGECGTRLDGVRVLPADCARLPTDATCWPAGESGEAAW